MRLSSQGQGISPVQIENDRGLYLDLLEHRGLHTRLKPTRSFSYPDCTFPPCFLRIFPTKLLQPCFDASLNRLCRYCSQAHSSLESPLITWIPAGLIVILRSKYGHSRAHAPYLHELSWAGLAAHMRNSFLHALLIAERDRIVRKGIAYHLGIF